MLDKQSGLQMREKRLAHAHQYGTRESLDIRKMSCFSNSRWNNEVSVYDIPKGSRAEQSVLESFFLFV